MREAAPVIIAAALLAGASFHAQAAGEEAKQFVQFVEDLDGKCTSRSGKMILVKSTHPSRKLRVWLDRYHMGTGTGDRSRSDLAPNAPAEPLGCSRTTDGPQEWRLVRAAFID